MSYFNRKLVYELIFCRRLILSIVFRSVNDRVGGLVTVVCQQSGLLWGMVDLDYLGNQIAEGKLRGRGYLQKIISQSITSWILSTALNCT
jgi:hypothetical protein